MTLLRSDRSVRAELIRDRIAEIRRLSEKIGALEKQIAAKVGESGTNLTQLRGIRFIVAAKILGRNRRSLKASVQGVLRDADGHGPLEASSGRTKRHRLNRGGNRQLNYALHTMALARRRGDRDTTAYMERLRGEGKSDKEAMRCLKRHLSTWSSSSS
jgi:transposase